MNQHVPVTATANFRHDLELPAVIATREAFAAMDDESADMLQRFLDAGFREVEWRYGFEAWQNTQLWRELGSVCPKCFALDGQRFKIDWLLQNMHHNAPKYSMSHVNCACQLFRISRGEEMLDYSETVDVAPGDIPGIIKDEPISLEEVSPEQRDQLGLPSEINDFTNIEWQWDPVSRQMVPLETLQNAGTPAAPEGAAPTDFGGDWVFDPNTHKMVPQGE